MGSNSEIFTCTCVYTDICVLQFIRIYVDRDFVATLISNINRLGIDRIWSDVVELNNTPVR